VDNQDGFAAGRTISSATLPKKQMVETAPSMHPNHDEIRRSLLGFLIDQATMRCVSTVDCAPFGRSSQPGERGLMFRRRTSFGSSVRLDRLDQDPHAACRRPSPKSAFGRITQDEYDKKARELKERQTEIALRIEQHQKGEGDFRRRWKA
jgi:hypothetical protein